MSAPNIKTIIYAVAFTTILFSCLGAQVTVYNNFGPGHDGWDYNFGLGWTVAGDDVAGQYGVEQAMEFQSTADGLVTDIWVAFFYVPSSSPPDTVTIRLTGNPDGSPPVPENVMEEWTITEFESWDQWSPPIHLQGNNLSVLQEGESYWLWAIGGETTWCGWCVNIDPALTCPHTLRREGEDWLPVFDETASAFRIDVDPAIYIKPFDNNIPQNYSLSQNYPNPFNGSTLISYNLPYQSLVTIEICDILGRHIKTIQGGLQPAGYHQVIWNADDFSSGNYFYKIQAGNYTETKKMLLLK
jgi:hypothetical protein